jgi:hypothetical protein
MRRVRLIGQVVVRQPSLAAPGAREPSQKVSNERFSIITTTTVSKGASSGLRDGSLFDDDAAWAVPASGPRTSLEAVRPVAAVLI